MDDEKLISLIKLHPPLWRKANQTNVNRLEIEKTWDGIADELHTTKKECRKRWKNLKYYRVRHFRKYPQQTPGTLSEELKAAFKYAELMNFLADGCSSTENITISDDEDSLIDNDDTSKESPSISQPNNTSYKRTATIKDEYESVNKRLKLTSHEVEPRNKKDHESGHMLFFQSLIPFIQYATPAETLRIRREIQEVVLRYVEEKEENLFL